MGDQLAELFRSAVQFLRPPREFPVHLAHLVHEPLGVFLRYRQLIYQGF